MRSTYLPLCRRCRTNARAAGRIGCTTRCRRVGAHATVSDLVALRDQHDRAHEAVVLERAVDRGIDARRGAHGVSGFFKGGLAGQATKAVRLMVIEPLLAEDEEPA